MALSRHAWLQYRPCCKRASYVCVKPYINTQCSGLFQLCPFVRGSFDSLLETMSPQHASHTLHSEAIVM